MTTSCWRRGRSKRGDLGHPPPSGRISHSTILRDSDAFNSLGGAGSLNIGDLRGAAGSYVKTKQVSAGEIQLKSHAIGDVETAAANNRAAVRINVNLTSALTIAAGTLSVAKSNGLGVGSLMNFFLGHEPNGDPHRRSLML